MGAITPPPIIVRVHSAPQKLTSWAHRHEFVRVDDATTEVVDRVEATHKKHLWWGLVSRLMWAGMPTLFAFRANKTRKLLEVR
ncbi:MAG: hypothetical protein MUC34_21480 [Anaerolineae bacterium]|nr:hypothetical protein [Anaerolineae bacterium]